MFALEINFKDPKVATELLLVKRPQAIIGSSDTSHVVIEDMKGLDYAIQISRGVGRQFKCQPLFGGEAAGSVPGFLEGVYDGTAFFDLGVVKLHVTALDSDLLLRDKEAPDRAGVRVLRQSVSFESPLFPALLVGMKPPVVVSFSPDQPVLVGRSKRCAVRLDSSEISSEHARLGFEGGKFWVEDLGSTNGTFIEGHQISGRQTIDPLIQVTLARDIPLIGLATNTDLLSVSSPVKPKSNDVEKKATQTSQYPALLSCSNLVRPARVVVRPGMTFLIGRDPSCDLWIGAPHVSRQHCELKISVTGVISLTDLSTNGTAHDTGILSKGEMLEIRALPKVIDFGNKITVAVCFSKEDEDRFKSVEGARDSFVSSAISTMEYDSVAMSANVERAGLFFDKKTSSIESYLDRLISVFLSFGLAGRTALIVVFIFCLLSIFLLVYLLIPVFSG